MKYICIHGHFYQPPRENPWIDEIESQPGAAPYSDWNERVNAECYSQNAASRIHDSEGKINCIFNNYAYMSFNFGPTLLNWLERKDPFTYEAILEADKDSIKRFSGHGNAIAQCYNHTIMPLTSVKDKTTQVIWGIEDFRSRFNRLPEGMWLPETAVDTASLEVLAANDIKFTILAPYQAKEIRDSKGEWLKIDRLNTSQVYLCKLPSGKSISIFFYNKILSEEIAFKDLLEDGATLARRLVSELEFDNPYPQICHTATDGETFGHHHRFGDMALAFALRHIEEQSLANLTNYGEYLERHPPVQEIEIVENSSWSCVHGIERWQSDCGCNVNSKPGWNQSWRTGLRNSLNYLKITSDNVYESIGAKYFASPWKARDKYISVILDGKEEVIRNFIDQVAIESGEDNSDDIRIKLLELQKYSMLMFTSCGWFFDDLYEVQTMQSIRYAGKVLQLIESLTGESIEDEFIALLNEAQSNNVKIGSGSDLFKREIRPFIQHGDHLDEFLRLDLQIAHNRKNRRFNEILNDCLFALEMKLQGQPLDENTLVFTRDSLTAIKSCGIEADLWSLQCRFHNSYIKSDVLGKVDGKLRELIENIGTLLDFGDNNFTSHDSRNREVTPI